MCNNSSACDLEVFIEPLRTLISSLVKHMYILGWQGEGSRVEMIVERIDRNDL